ncbi:MAG: homoserine kinase [Nitrososphaerota archaeon]
MSEVWCKVPSSSANLGPGFDVFSMALSEPTLFIGAKFTDSPAPVEIDVVAGKYANEISLSPEKNAAGIAANLLLRKLQLNKHVKIMIKANIPVRKGLGASGAEAVGAIVALSALFELDIKPMEVIELASSVEPEGHADNVAASMLGGINIISRLNGKLDLLTLQPPTNLGLVVIVPNIAKVSTESARRVIPSMVKMRDCVRNVSQASMIVAGLLYGDLGRVFRYVSFDYVVEASRADAGVYGEGYSWKTLLEEKQTLLDEYNVALTISGAGPSRLLWYDLYENPENTPGRPIDKAVKLVTDNLEKHGYKVEEIIYTRPARQGATLVTF